MQVYIPYQPTSISLAQLEDTKISLYLPKMLSILREAGIPITNDPSTSEKYTCSLFEHETDIVNAYRAKNNLELVDTALNDKYLTNTKYLSAGFSALPMQVIDSLDDIANFTGSFIIKPRTGSLSKDKYDFCYKIYTNYSDALADINKYPEFTLNGFGNYLIQKAIIDNCESVTDSHNFMIIPFFTNGTGKVEVLEPQLKLWVNSQIHCHSDKELNSSTTVEYKSLVTAFVKQENLKNCFGYIQLVNNPSDTTGTWYPVDFGFRFNYTMFNSVQYQKDYYFGLLRWVYDLQDLPTNKPTEKFFLSRLFVGNTLSNTELANLCSKYSAVRIHDNSPYIANNPHASTDNVIVFVTVGDTSLEAKNKLYALGTELSANNKPIYTY